MPNEEETRQQAIRAVKRKREFKTHVVAYIIGNLFLVGVWYFSGGHYFWPVWVMAGWGVALAFNAWGVYGRQPDAISEGEIQREIKRQHGTSGG
ncbi:MAG TPA: 2TM domain-containing protein [Thermoleophilia bacterium]|nr:2TM domain-containing protein [Thermoleophilia bacterium]